MQESLRNNDKTDIQANGWLTDQFLLPIPLTYLLEKVSPDCMEGSHSSSSSFTDFHYALLETNVSKQVIANPFKLTLRISLVHKHSEFLKKRDPFKRVFLV